jgi:small subunit ribosomal protein S6
MGRPLSSPDLMAEQSTLYDLLLLLSNDAPAEQREKILSMVQSAVQGAGGTIERDDDWGRRPLAYEIRHQPEAEYHLLQFEAPGSMIDELSHTLRITDGVLRFRVIKVRPGTPPVRSGPPPVVATVASAASVDSHPAPARPEPPASDEGEEQDSGDEYSAEE